MTKGNMIMGNRRMLKRERATKALSAVRGSSDTRTYVANVERATWEMKRGFVSLRH